jgi:two-component system KDP operon response regulator KdpE
MLTARSEPEEIVRGLELGADDYIPKPFNKDVLLARTRANLRRVHLVGEVRPPSSSIQDKADYEDKRLQVYFNQHRVVVNGEGIRLSPTEFRLLQMLIEAAPRVLPYRNLLETVWGFEYIDDINYLRVYIWHLRSKIEPDAKDPIYIINELGLGYRFESQV